MRVSLFVTCFNDTLFPQTGRATVRLLERLGCEVDFPLEQTCCGQMHMNSGYPREGVALARRFARVFEGAEMVVTPSASCAGMLRQQLGEDAGPSAPPVLELTEFLVDRLPAIHKNRSEIREVFARELNLPRRRPPGVPPRAARQRPHRRAR